MSEKAPQKSLEKDNRIAQLREDVDAIIDGIGNPMDEGIKETVVYFMAHDFPTNASCEGHLWEAEHIEKGSGPSIAPWVDIGINPPEGWEKDPAKEAVWIQENMKLQAKLLDFLNEFYRERSESADTRLVITPLLDADDVERGAFRFSNQGRHLIESLPPEKQVQRQKIYQQEMKDFTEFLKTKFYQQ